MSSTSQARGVNAARRPKGMRIPRLALGQRARREPGAITVGSVCGSSKQKNPTKRTVKSCGCLTRRGGHIAVPFMFPPGIQMKVNSRPPANDFQVGAFSPLSFIEA